MAKAPAAKSDSSKAAKLPNTPQARIPLGPAIAWPANVPTTISANAGNAARRISSNRRFGPPFTLEENHERVGDASEKNDLVDEAGIKLWIRPA